MKILKYLFILISAICIIACGGSDDNGGDTNPTTGGKNPTTGGDNPTTGGGNPSTGGDTPTTGDTPPTTGGETEATPEKAILVFPDNGKTCTTGIFLDNSTDSTVTFEWEIAKDATKYLVTYTNTDTGIKKTKDSSINSADIVLNQNANYEWTVTAINTTKETISDKWTFYNAAKGLNNFAPFPAKLINPENKAELTTVSGIRLEWEASGFVNNEDDIDAYEVYLDTNTNPTTLLESTSDISVQIPETVTASTSYYWKVVTKDKFGNETESQIFSFITP